MGDGDDVTENSQSGGTCPVRHGEASSNGSAAMWQWLGNATAKQENDTAEKPPSSSSSCSVASIEEAAKYAQTPQPDQRLRLDINRQVSTIPRGSIASSHDASSAAPVPHHQHDMTESNWVYPSEQQMFNAMRKKGFHNVPEESMPVVLQIHNAVNEVTWQKICQWEGTDQIELTKFEGRPRDLTPKAFVLSKLLHWNPLPFDRHDWYVHKKKKNQQSANAPTDSSSPETPTRYVIDYYMMDDPRDPQLPPLTHIDARPALDGTRGVYLRMERFFKMALPGIATTLEQWQQQPQRQPSASSEPRPSQSP